MPSKLCVVLAVATLALLGPALGADMSDSGLFSPERLKFSHQYELRGGVFAHGIGSVERDTADVNAELVFPRLPFGTDEWWTIFVPRPHVGGFLSTDNRTSIAYGGALWTYAITDRLFTELFFGGAVHDGLPDGSPTRAALGCNVGFNFGSTAGYRIDRSWSLMVTYDHMSNGNSSVGTNCSHNKGINNVGVKLGYSF